MTDTRTGPQEDQVARIADVLREAENAWAKFVHTNPTKISRGARWPERESWIAEWLVDNAAGLRLPDSRVDIAEPGLREAGDGYEVRTWVRHEPSGVVVLKGHPQLGGRYCLTDGGDWPCAAVRAARLREA